MDSFTVALWMSAIDVPVETVETSLSNFDGPTNPSGRPPATWSLHSPLCLSCLWPTVPSVPWLEPGADENQTVGRGQHWHGDSLGGRRHGGGVFFLPEMVAFGHLLVDTTSLLLQQSWKSNVSTHLTTPTANNSL